MERGGKAKVFHVAVADKAAVQKIVLENVHPASRLHTDESRLYHGMGTHFAGHETTKHTGGEYVRYDGDRVIHSNNIESYFSVF